jgi:hypothetical protein
MAQLPREMDDLPQIGNLIDRAVQPPNVEAPRNLIDQKSSKSILIDQAFKRKTFD